MSLVSSALIGVATGCRSQAGLGALSLTPAGPGRVDRLLHRSRRAAVLQVLGETVADKLPIAPPRTAFPGFSVRLVLGAVTAGVLASRRGEPVLPAAAAGTAASAAASYGGMAARGLLARRLGSDLPGAVGEDVLALGLAFAATRVR